ncbi:MAG: T9SS type A sorting domain-containing protein [Saprospiraceae bacterium]
MKQLLLSAIIAMLAIPSLFAQDIIWQEDFSKGMAGWTTNPLICGSNAGAQFGNNSGPEFGIWELSSAIVDGETITLEPGEVFEWSFLNPKEYMVVFYNSDLSFYGTVYGTYEIDDNNVMTSSVDPAAIVPDGVAFAEQTANGIVTWATNLNVESVDQVSGLVGLNNPTVVLSNGGATLTYTSGDGATVMIMNKRNECGTLWTWSPNGNLGYGIFGQQPGVALVNSVTRANGVMVMNNIYQMTQGDASVVPSPNPPPYPHYVSELISPPIDISGADRALSIRVTQFMAYLNTPTEAPNGLKTSFSVSTDDGITWSPASDLNPNFPTNTLRSNTVSAPVLNAYTEGADEIRIKLTFATDFYFWGIDDIVLSERVGYEMQANANFYAIPDNVNTPFSQLQPQFFMSDIQNNGGLAAENVVLNVTVTDANGAELLNADNIYGTIPPDSLAENDFFDAVLDLPADMGSMGSYFGTYTLRHDSVASESNTANDTLRFSFAVTDTLFAKETGRTRGIFLTTAPDWYIGNSYYAPHGEGWYARWVSFMIDNADDAAAGAGSVTLLLFESDGDVNGDGRIGADEYNGGYIAFNDYFFDGTENQELITIPVSVDEEGIPLQDGKYYFAVVQYVSAGDNDGVAISASEQYNYNANNFITDSIGIEQYSDVVDLVGENPNFFSGGFGGTVVPIVRLHIGDNADLTAPAITMVNTEDVLPAEFGLTVYPVPADDFFNVNMDFPEQVDVLVRFYDQTGRILFTQHYDQLQEGKFTYDTSLLANGIYFIQLDTDAGKRIEKVVVQH